MPDAEIVRFAEADPNNVIMMGSHSRAAIEHVRLGAVAQRVLCEAHGLMLTIRHPDQRIQHP